MAPQTPSTPSPHRFLTNPRTRLDPAARSSLRNQQAASPATSSPRPASSQFALTPRFSVRPPSGHNREDVDAPSKSSPSATRPRRSILKVPRGEDIQDTSDHDEKDSDVNQTATATATATVEDPVADGDGDATSAQPRSHKRKRSPPPRAGPHSAISVSDSDDDDNDNERNNNTDSTSDHSDTAPPVHTPAPPRFHFPNPTIDSSTFIPQSTHPHFVLPTASTAAEPAPPLPDAFSPHRRGAKYLPSGLAATVREWILSASTLTSQPRSTGSSRTRGLGRDGEYANVIRIRQVKVGEGMVLVQGTRVAAGVGERVRGIAGEEEGQGERWILIQGGRSAEGAKAGAVVGVQLPVWDVEIADVTWGVGVEWSVLS